MLRLGGAEVKISYLELLDNNIGPRGGLALGNALTQMNNLSLLTLKLDYNTTFGSQGKPFLLLCVEPYFVSHLFFVLGVSNLCRGLRTNLTLKQLHLQFCNITSDGGSSLSDLLANSKSGLLVLNVAGNRLGGVGLSALCKGLMVNTKLESLSLADNMIDEVLISCVQKQLLYIIARKLS